MPLLCQVPAGTAQNDICLCRLTARPCRPGGRPVVDMVLVVGSSQQFSSAACVPTRQADMGADYLIDGAEDARWVRRWPARWNHRRRFGSAGARRE